MNALLCQSQFNVVLDELKKYFHFYNLNLEYDVVIKKNKKFSVLEIIDFRIYFIQNYAGLTYPKKYAGFIQKLIQEQAQI